MRPSVFVKISQIVTDQLLLGNMKEVNQARRANGELRHVENIVFHLKTGG